MQSWPKMAKMDLVAAIRSFQKVIEAGSFSGAARELGVLPSSVTRQVDALEAELGVRLLQRSTRQTVLTEAGQLYLERISDALRSLDEAKREVALLGRAPQGVLRVGLPLAFGHRHIVPLLPSFLARYPSLKLALFFADKFVDFARDDIDLTIRVGAVEGHEVVAKKLLGNRRWICASRAYLESRGVPKTPAALEKHNCLLYRYHHGRLIWYLRRGGSVSRIAVNGNVSADSGEALRELALHGCGVALLPDWLIDNDVQRGALVKLFADYDVTVSSAVEELGVYAVYPTSRRASPKVEALVSYLRNELRQIFSSPAP